MATGSARLNLNLKNYFVYITTENLKGLFLHHKDPAKTHKSLRLYEALDEDYGYYNRGQVFYAEVDEVEKE